MINKIKWITPITVLGLGLLLYCTKNNQSTGVVDDTDTSIKAMLYNPDGTKAVGATVKFFAPQDTSKREKYSVVTNTEGRYEVTNIATGNYNVWAEKDSLIAFQGNVYISGDTNFIKPDTLKFPASISGIVGVEPNHDPENVTVQILGTEIYSMVDAGQRFTLKKLGEGDFTLRFTTTDPGYVATLFDWKTTRGKADTIPDTVWLKYTGIPVVRGVIAKFDTINGIVRLSWNKTTYKDIQDYWIYRDNNDSIVLTANPLASRTDTFFIDSIYKKSISSGKFSFADSSSYTFKYRVAIRNNSQKVGETYKFVTIATIPYQNVIPLVNMVTTTFDTAKGIANIAWDSVSMPNGFGGYRLIRTKIKINSSTISIDTLGVIQKTAYSDSLFGVKIPFSDSNSYTVSYSVSIYRNDWNLYGKQTTSNTITISPYYTKVPVANNIKISYDTLKGSLNVSWDSSGDVSNISGFKISRRIINTSGNIDRSDTFTVKNGFSFNDIIYPELIGFTNIGNTSVTYTIAARHKAWGITGIGKTQSISIASYKKFIPIINAGPDQNVDISSDVILQGKVTSSAWPVKKLEWKIGDSVWAACDSGKATFKTNSNYNTETIVCVFRATDSIGNIGLDTVNVIKQQLVVSFGTFPGSSQSTSTTFLNKIWCIGNGVWSTSDCITWKKETQSPGIQWLGQLISCGNFLYSFHFGFDNVGIDNYGLSNFRDSYKTQDGISWVKINPNLPQTMKTILSDSIYWTNFSNVCTKDNKLYVIGYSKITKTYDSWGTIIQDNFDTLYTSIGGVSWNATVLSIKVNPKHLVCYKQKLILNTVDKRFSSSDNGLTWTEDALWDNDYNNFPDQCNGLFGNDSTIVAFYNEEPSETVKVMLLRNDIWTEIPFPDTYAYNIFLFSNRLIYLSNDSKLKSIKLY